MVKKEVVVNRLKNISKLKVAVVYDLFMEFGGGERITHTILNLFPNAHLYTYYFNYNDKLLLKYFRKFHIHSSFVQKIPLIYKLGKYFSFFKLIANYYWENLDFTKYDLVISVSFSFNAKAILTPVNVPHICYMITPPKYLYQEFNELNWIKQKPWNIIFSPFISKLRVHDYISSFRPDYIISESKTVQKRTKKYYGHDSLVIYPPINVLANLKKGKRKGEYYLFYSRLSKQKGPLIAVQACMKARKKLVVVGIGNEFKRLKSLSGENIEFKGQVDLTKMSPIFERAKALLFCSKDEDFGMVPLEAMAYGLPVIAYSSGGVKETVIHNRNGILFHEYSVNGLTKAIREFEKTKFSATYIKKYSQKFSNKVFLNKLRRTIINYLKDHESFVNS